jgi:hypothetical protein
MTKRTLIGYLQIAYLFGLPARQHGLHPKIAVAKGNLHFLETRIALLATVDIRETHSTG